MRERERADGEPDEEAKDGSDFGHVFVSAECEAFEGAHEW